MLESKVPVEAEMTLLRKQIMGIKRRVADRYRCPLATPGKIDLPDEGSFVQAWVYNLSITGAGLNVDHPMDIDTEVILQLRRSEKHLTLELSARIAHCTQELDGSWRIGCEFHEPLSADLLDDLLE